MIKVFSVARSVHRILVLIISLFGLVMTGTGLILRYSALQRIVSVSTPFIRYIHGAISTYFTITLQELVIYWG